MPTPSIRKRRASLIGTSIDKLASWAQWKGNGQNSYQEQLSKYHSVNNQVCSTDTLSSHKLNVSGKWPPKVTSTEVKRNVLLEYGRGRITHRNAIKLPQEYLYKCLYISEEGPLHAVPCKCQLASSAHIPTFLAVTIQNQDWGLRLSSSGHISKAPTEAKPNP